MCTRPPKNKITPPNIKTKFKTFLQPLRSYAQNVDSGRNFAPSLLRPDLRPTRRVWARFARKTDLYPAPCLPASQCLLITDGEGCIFSGNWRGATRKHWSLLVPVRLATLPLAQGVPGQHGSRWRRPLGPPRTVNRRSSTFHTSGHRVPAGWLKKKAQLILKSGPQRRSRSLRRRRPRRSDHEAAARRRGAALTHRTAGTCQSDSPIPDAGAAAGAPPTGGAVRPWRGAWAPAKIRPRNRSAEAGGGLDASYRWRLPNRFPDS